LLKILDSDEGIRIDNEDEHVFVNKTAKRYCIDISNGARDEFHYRDNADETVNFLKKYIKNTSKIFAY
ncbi:MAG: hypothetical protein KGH95_08225, partial [Thaumarchaeota archaeon]|nr:hypothetical protein [Nitrososphaerota archaeon]